MALHKIAWTGNRSGWAVWKITEKEEDLQGLVYPEVCPPDVHSPEKRLEWLAGRVLLRNLLERAGLSYLGVRKDAFGKPFLEKHPHPISLSHSYPYVAVQIDDHQSVGIDVEQPKAKLLRVAHRVLSLNEQQDAGQDITKNCVYWCAKEALYKIYGQRGLTFSKNLPIQPFALNKEGQLTGRILVDGLDRMIKLEYSIEGDFVLVYTQPTRL